MQAAILGILGIVFAGDPDASELTRFVWSGMKDNTDRLRGGIVQVRGRKVDDDPKNGRLEGEVEVFIAFDRPAGRLRFDRIEPIRVIPDGAPTGADPKRWVVGKRGGKFVRTPERTVSHLLDDFTATIGRPNDPPPGAVPPFDVRSLGLMYFSDFQGEFDFEDRFKSWTTRTVDRVETLPDQIDRMVFIDEGKNPLKTTIWFDRKAGFMPIRFELRLGDSAEPKTVSQTTYVQISGVWVPRTFQISDDWLAPRHQSYELSFDWTAVNETVVDELFDEKSFNLKKGTYLVNRQLGKPIVVGGIGINPKSLPKFAEKSNDVGRRGRRSWVAAVIAAQVVALAMLGAYLWRRRRSSSENGPKNGEAPPPGVGADGGRDDRP